MLSACINSDIADKARFYPYFSHCNSTKIYFSSSDSFECVGPKLWCQGASDPSDDRRQSTAGAQAVRQDQRGEGRQRLRLRNGLHSVHCYTVT